MGFSATAGRMMWPPSLSRDRKWLRVTTCTHSRVVGLRLECNLVVQCWFSASGCVALIPHRTLLALGLPSSPPRFALPVTEFLKTPLVAGWTTRAPAASPGAGRRWQTSFSAAVWQAGGSDEVGRSRCVLLITVARQTGRAITLPGLERRGHLAILSRRRDSWLQRSARTDSDRLALLYRSTAPGCSNA